MANSLVQLVYLPTIFDDCALTVGQAPDIPFPVKRIYYIYDAKPGAPRGMHAHYQTDQVLFCLRGTVRLVLDDGRTRAEVTVREPTTGVLLPKMVWHEMHDMTPETFLLVLASAPYQEKDYIRKYTKFKALFQPPAKGARDVRK